MLTRRAALIFRAPDEHTQNSMPRDILRALAVFEGAMPRRFVSFRCCYEFFMIFYVFPLSFAICYRRSSDTLFLLLLTLLYALLIRAAAATDAAAFCYAAIYLYLIFDMLYFVSRA